MSFRVMKRNVTGGSNRMLAAMFCCCALFSFATGCAKKKKNKEVVFEPKLIDKHYPPALRGLRLCQSTQKDILERFKNLRVHKDKRLGGKAKKVEYGGEPAVVLEVSYSGMKEKIKDGVHEARFFLTKAKDGEFRLSFAEVMVPVKKGESNIAFLKKAIGSHDKAKDMPGSNRSFRDRGDSSVEYAAGTADGKRGVYVSGARRERGGVSMERVTLSVVTSDDSGYSIVY